MIFRRASVDGSRLECKYEDEDVMSEFDFFLIKVSLALSGIDPRAVRSFSPHYIGTYRLQQ